MVSADTSELAPGVQEWPSNWRPSPSTSVEPSRLRIDSISRPHAPRHNWIVAHPIALATTLLVPTCPEKKIRPAAVQAKATAVWDRSVPCSIPRRFFFERVTARAATNVVKQSHKFSYVSVDSCNNVELKYRQNREQLPEKQYLSKVYTEMSKCKLS